MKYIFTNEKVNFATARAKYNDPKVEGKGVIECDFNQVSFCKATHAGNNFCDKLFKHEKFFFAKYKLRRKGGMSLLMDHQRRKKEREKVSHQNS